MKIYCISDTHFGHDKLVELSGRPSNFGNKLLGNLFKLSGDLLIHCGDFCIGNNEEHTKAFMAVAGGFKKKCLVRGNHDKQSDNWYMERGWDFVCERFENTYFGKRVVFTHTPILLVERIQFSANVHGHMHGNQHCKEPVGEYDPTFHIDLAPEIRDYAPVSLEKLLSTHN